MAEIVKVDGLNEFVRNLKKMDRDLPKAVRIAFNEAADVVVKAAQPNVPRRTGRAAASLKARSTQKKARVVGGSSRAPYYPWLDFGGRVGRNKSVERAYLSEGRYIYPAFRANRDRFADVMVKALVDVANKSGIEVE